MTLRQGIQYAQGLMNIGQSMSNAFERGEKKRQQEQADQLYAEAFDYIKQGNNTSESNVAQQQKKTMVGPGEDNISKPVAQGLGLKQSQQGQLQASGNAEMGQTVSMPGLQAPGQQQTQGTDSNLSPDDPLVHVGDNLKKVEEYFSQVDKDKYDPAAFRAAKTKAISDVVDSLKANSQYKKLKAQNVERKRQQLLPQAMSALEGFEQGDPESVKQLANVLNEAPNGRKFDYDKESGNVMIWDVSEEKTPENAQTMSLNEVSRDQAKDFVMSQFAPKQFMKMSLADDEAARKINMKQMTDPYAFKTKDGKRIYGAPVIDRRNDNQMRWQFWGDRYTENPIDPKEAGIDPSEMQPLGRLSELGDEGPTIEVGGQKVPYEDATAEMKNKAFGLGTGSNKEGSTVNIPGIGSMERSNAINEFNDQLDILANAETQNLSIDKLVQKGTSEQEKRTILGRVEDIANDKNKGDLVRNAAQNTLRYYDALWGGQESKDSGGDDKGGSEKPWLPFMASPANEGNNQPGNATQTNSSGQGKQYDIGKEGGAVSSWLNEEKDFNPEKYIDNSTQTQAERGLPTRKKAAKNMAKSLEDSPLTTPKKIGEQIVKKAVQQGAGLSDRVFIDPIEATGNTVWSLLKDFRKWSKSRYASDNGKSVDEQVEEYADEHPEKVKKIGKKAQQQKQPNKAGIGLPSANK